MRDPRKGRFREFWQFGVELIGSEKPDADAEVIALADALLKAVGVSCYMKIGNLAVIRTLLRGLQARNSKQDHAACRQERICRLGSPN